MEIDIVKEARNVFDIEIAELEKLKSKLGDTFQKLVQMILELKNNNKVVVTGIGKSGIIGKKNCSDTCFNWDNCSIYKCGRSASRRFGNGQ